MIVIKLDAVFGAKYVALIEGGIRECFLQAVVLDKYSHGTPQYVLTAAGIRNDVRINVDYSSFSVKDEEPVEFNSILANSYEDFLQGNFVKFRQLDTNEPCCFPELVSMFPIFHHDGENLYGWRWSPKHLKAVKEQIDEDVFSMWRIDANGIFCDIPEGYYYSSEEECLKDNEKKLELIRF